MTPTTPSEPRFWVCTWLGANAGAHVMVIVEAEDIDAAAQEGAEILDADLREEHQVEVDKVGVAELAGPIKWFGVQWRAHPAAVPAEYQCCGGNEHTDDGHSGYCPLKLDAN